jgi:hypothetical protein
MNGRADPTTPLPFDGYPSGGRALLGRPKGDIARRGYARDVLAWCGFQCAYCGLDMSIFEGWLQLSVDHVVPQQATGVGFAREWVLDASNLVACCRSCNDLFNRDPVVDPVPAGLESFFDLRDRLYVARRARIIERRATERRWFEENVLPVAGSTPESLAAATFSMAWLESTGFSGFQPVAGLQRTLDGVPYGPGVYVVVATSSAAPRILSASRGGWFKGKDPSVAPAVLRARWHAETPILYFGKADALRKRIKDLVRFAAGEPVAHWGGRYLWQISGSASFLIAWREDDEPRALERDLLASFASQFGTLPFANIVG